MKEESGKQQESHRNEDSGDNALQPGKDDDNANNTLDAKTEFSFAGPQPREIRTSVTSTSKLEDYSDSIKALGKQEWHKGSGESLALHAAEVCRYKSKSRSGQNDDLHSFLTKNADTSTDLNVDKRNGQGDGQNLKLSKNVEDPGRQCDGNFKTLFKDERPLLLRNDNVTAEKETFSFLLHNDIPRHSQGMHNNIFHDVPQEFRLLYTGALLQHCEETLAFFGSLPTDHFHSYPVNEPTSTTTPWGAYTTLFSAPSENYGRSNETEMQSNGHQEELLQSDDNREEEGSHLNSQ